MPEIRFAEDVLVPVAAGDRLTEDTATAAMRCVVAGSVAPEQAAAFALALAARGETVDELAGMARAAMEAAVPLGLDSPECLLDTCGTGGDGRNTFNISTAAAVVASAAGTTVAKHGNRAASSACGSADVLVELGVDVTAGPGRVAQALGRDGIAFLSAPVFHPGFRHVAPIRRSLRARTAFNLLGPLCNPARAGLRVLGVPRPDLVAPMAEVLHRLGVRRALVVHSLDGTDELVPGVPADAVELDGGAVRAGRIDTGVPGLGTVPDGALAGGGPTVNASILRAVLTGERGPRRDVVLLNAAAALQVAGRCADLAEGVVLAGAAIDGGAAGDRLADWIAAGRDRAGTGVPA